MKRPTVDIPIERPHIRLVNSQGQSNCFFHAPSDDELFDLQTRSRVLAEFVDLRTRFLDRIACANVFDSELFSGVLLALDWLRRSHAAHEEPIPATTFHDFQAMETKLAEMATHSKTQRQDFAVAHRAWLDILSMYAVPTKATEPREPGAPRIL